MNANTNNNGRELSWDSLIEKESEFTLLDEGDYPFRVESFTRGRHGGSAKLPACPKAILKIAVLDPNTQKTLTTIEHNLFLHSSVEGLLSSFFIAVGLKKHGEPTKMNFEGAVGRTGMCHVYVDKWKGTDGKDKQSNKIKYFLDRKDDPTQPAQAAYQQPVPQTYSQPVQGAPQYAQGTGQSTPQYVQPNMPNTPTQTGVPQGWGNLPFVE